MGRQTKLRGKHRATSRSARCRDGNHVFGDPASIGGGLVRSVCTVCGEISIDLRIADEPKTPGLFIDTSHTRRHEREKVDTIR
jgi:hypothetical protein